MQQVLSLLRLSGGDSDVFYKFRHVRIACPACRILASHAAVQVFIDKTAYPHASENVIRDMRRDIDAIARTYYPLQQSKDVCFELGRMFMNMKVRRLAAAHVLCFACRRAVPLALVAATGARALMAHWRPYAGLPHRH